jgi:hypothetical protein
MSGVLLVMNFSGFFGTKYLLEHLSITDNTTVIFMLVLYCVEAIVIDLCIIILWISITISIKSKRNIKNKYINTFFSNLSKKEKEEIHFEQYMWHVFSYNKVSAKKGTEAIESLRKHNKNEVYVIFQRQQKVLEEKDITYEQIYNNVLQNNIWDTDCYIIDKEFKWTFILTHETIDEELEAIFKKHGEIPEDILADVKNKEFYIGPFYTEI